MAHHGWVPVIDASTLTPSGLKSPFGRLFEATDHTYNSHAISLLFGAGSPVQAAATPKPSPKPGNPVGFTFLGQFIDHDLTEFRVINTDNRVVATNPTIGQRQRVLEDGAPTTTNGRLGLLDLDCVYGLLGVAQPDLFDDKGLFILHNYSVASPHTADIVRGGGVQHGRLIADPRNDESKLITQIHMLFQKLHNKVHSAKSGSAADLRPGGKAFEQTKQAVVAAYQRIVFADYLRHIVQQPHLDAVTAKLKQGTSFYQRMNKRAEKAYLRHLGETSLADTPVDPDQTVPGAGTPLVAMPVEFAHAVFRLGHSQLREGYRLNSNGDGLSLFGTVGNDLRGNDPLSPATLIDWELFFDIGGQTAGRGEPLDGVIARTVFRLPPPAIDAPPVSLAERNVRRGVDFGLPSGQQAASYLSTLYGGIEGLTQQQLFPASRFGDLATVEALRIDASLAYATPLWYYILCEAEQYTDGPQLGAVGGLIVAETMLGGLVAEGFDLDGAAKAAPPLNKAQAREAPASVSDIWFMSDLVQFL